MLGLAGCANMSETQQDTGKGDGIGAIAGALLGAGLTVPDVFLLTGLVNALVATYVCVKVPAYMHDLRTMLGRPS